MSSNTAVPYLQTPHSSRQVTSEQDSKGSSSRLGEARAAVSKFFSNQCGKLAEIGRANLHDLKRLHAYVTCSTPPLPRWLSQPDWRRSALTRATTSGKPLDDVISEVIKAAQDPRAKVSGSESTKLRALVNLLGPALIDWCKTHPLDDGLRQQLASAESRLSTGHAARLVLEDGVLPRLQDLMEAPGIDPSQKDLYSLMAQMVSAFATGNEAGVACLNPQHAHVGNLSEMEPLSKELTAMGMQVRAVMGAGGELLSAPARPDESKHGTPTESPNSSRSGSPEGEAVRFKNQPPGQVAASAQATVRLHENKKGEPSSSDRGSPAAATSTSPRHVSMPERDTVEPAKQAVLKWIAGLNKAADPAGSPSFQGKYVFVTGALKPAGAKAPTSTGADPIPQIRAAMDQTCRTHFEKWANAVATRLSEQIKEGESPTRLVDSVAKAIEQECSSLVDELPEPGLGFVRDVWNQLDALSSTSLAIPGNIAECGMRNVVLLHGLLPAVERLAAEAGPLQVSYRALASVIGPLAVPPEPLVAEGKRSSAPGAAPEQQSIKEAREVITEELNVKMIDS